jgi:hypothetical protein
MALGIVSVLNRWVPCTSKNPPQAHFYVKVRHESHIEIRAIPWHWRRRRRYFGSTEATLSAHKFRVGESVHYNSGPAGRGGPSGVYKIVKVLPSEDDDQQYRIKSANEPHERVAKQSQLDKLA